MTRMSVDIPQTVIDKAASGELKAAHKKIASLETKVRKLESEAAEYKELIEAAKSLRDYIDVLFERYYD